ncbi:MAG: hypothetical protein QOE92_379 [Chloroflexota bacterium]|jgi:hypothetical protein|nr:hypothetical protein [Chloroflexota bacterium]
MPARKLMTRAAAAALLLANLAVIGVASAADSNRPVYTPTRPGVIQQGTTLVAPAPAEDQRGAAASNIPGSAPTDIGIAPPGQPGVFQPAYPGFSTGGVAGDGVTAWGVAFREVPNATTEPDAALLKSAFEDAHKRAQALADAVGVKLGELAGISDQAANQPFYGECVKPLPAQGVPEGSAPGSSGSGGSTGSGVAPDGTVTSIAPAPPCAEKHYAVAWVLVRYRIA